MKKTLLGLLLSTSLLAVGVVSVSAVENTNPDGGLPENDPARIGATSGIASATLLSPIYTVQNNSGRPVSGAYESIAQQADTTDNYGLDLTLEATAVKGATIVNKTTNLITAGDIQNPASPNCNCEFKRSYYTWSNWNSD